MAWGGTVDEAITTLLLRLHGEAPPEVSHPAAEEERPAPRRPAAEEKSVGGLARQAREHFDEAQEAARRGDWARYGRELEKLQAALEALLEETERGQR